MPHWPHKGRGDNSHLDPVKRQPYAITVVITGTIPTVQIQTDKMHVWSHPLRDGIHDKGLDERTIQTSRVPWPRWSGSRPSAPQSDQAIDDPGRLPNLGTTPLGTRRRWWMPRRTPHYTGRLTNHHRGYSATTAGTVVSHHILPQRGQKTMTIAMTNRAPEDGVAYKPS
jgi:hypothetical protein